MTKKVRYLPVTILRMTLLKDRNDSPLTLEEEYGKRALSRITDVIDCPSFMF